MSALESVSSADLVPGQGWGVVLDKLEFANQVNEGAASTDGHSV